MPAVFMDTEPSKHYITLVAILHVTLGPLWMTSLIGVNIRPLCGVMVFWSPLLLK